MSQSTSAAASRLVPDSVASTGAAPAAVEVSGQLASPLPPEVSAVAAAIAGLADGNGASRADVKLLDGNSQTRPVRLVMKVAVGWDSTSKAVAGDRAVQGSKLCATLADAQQYLQLACGATCKDLAVAQSVADSIGISPVASYGSLQDGYVIGPLPHTAHRLEGCDTCEGDGRVRCAARGCVAGWVDCTACDRTGQAACPRCSGSRQEMVDGQYRSCSKCHGTGRHGYCPVCSGNVQIACTSCHTSGVVKCGPCRGTGCFTRIHTTFLKARVSRSIVFDPDAPQGFQLACKAVSPLQELAATVGKLERPELLASAGEACLVLHCRTRHVHAEMDCRGQRVAVDALGERHDIPAMPAFLDKLLAGLKFDILSQADADPGLALRLAGGSRVTKEILSEAGRGRGGGTSAMSRRWRGAVSTAFVEELQNALVAAYRRAARYVVRRTWLKVLPLLCTEAVLVNAYHVPQHLLLHFFHRPVTGTSLLVGSAVCQAVAILPAVLLAWFSASRAGRSWLRESIGSAARRRPRQGAWPCICTVLALAAGCGASALHLDAAAMGLPFAVPEQAGQLPAGDAPAGPGVVGRAGTNTPQGAATSADHLPNPQRRH